MKSASQEIDELPPLRLAFFRDEVERVLIMAAGSGLAHGQIKMRRFVRQWI
jgi:hypothetical protein